MKYSSVTFYLLLVMCFQTAESTLSRPKRVVEANYQNSMVVNTTHGLVRGIENTIYNKTVDAYLGIPFAKPPLGDLRFKKPVPNGPWNGTFHAKKRPNACQQSPVEILGQFGTKFSGEEMFNPNTPISEDCLYLNLWVPRGSSNATTLIWIYGGGFAGGSSAIDVFDGSILAGIKNVIIASMNYRLGAFGFLYLGNDDAPGNMGLYDQALAIHWIKNNIEAFGGNPESLTLFGESAGAASVSAHLIYPISDHVIRRGILESGSMNSPWAFMTAEESKNASRAMMNQVKCNSSWIETNYTAAIKCLRSVNAARFLQAQIILQLRRGVAVNALAPVIDGIILQKDPIETLKEGNFPKAEVIIGTNEDEGTLFALYGFLQYFNKDNLKSISREDFNNIIGKMFKNDSFSQLSREAISLIYTDWDHVEEESSLTNSKGIIEMIGDYYFVCPLHYLAQHFVDHGSSVYYYQFTHRSSQSPWGQWMGVVHADEIPFVFGVPFNLTNSSFTMNEKNLSCRMMNYFTSFAKNGEPTSMDEATKFSWPKWSRKEPKYFVLNDNAAVELGLGPRSRFCALWNEFLPLLRKQQ